MKHAFIILAHTNWEQLEKLIKSLDCEGHDFFVHIDKKSGPVDSTRFKNCTEHSEVHLYQQYSVYWGGYSQVQTEMFMFSEASKYKYDYYHLISGGDLPLVSNQEIDIFFEKNAGFEFIDYDEEKRINDPEISRRAKYYHLFQNYRRRYKTKVFNELFTFVERCLLVLQICLCVNRLKNCNWKIMYGSNWLSITDDLVQEVLKHQDEIEKIFKWTNCADELFVQTIAYNCGYKDRIYCDCPKHRANMRYIDWNGSKNGNPRTFVLNDYQRIKDSGMLFARKFSETVDGEIIDRILQGRD